MRQISIDQNEKFDIFSEKLHEIVPKLDLGVSKLENADSIKETASIILFKGLNLKLDIKYSLRLLIIMSIYHSYELHGINVNFDEFAEKNEITDRELLLIYFDYFESKLKGKITNKIIKILSRICKILKYSKNLTDRALSLIEYIEKKQENSLYLDFNIYDLIAAILFISADIEDETIDKEKFLTLFKIKLDSIEIISKTLKSEINFSKKSISEKDWIENFPNASELIKNLSALGNYSFYDELSGEEIIKEYWTETRWKLAKINNKKYVLSPAFWKDNYLESRFALSCDPFFNLFVYIRNQETEHIVGRIGCYKILIDYSNRKEVKSKKKIRLPPEEELIATIQNLDYYFSEQVPTFMSFDNNIIYQALKLIIDNGFGSKSLLKLRCEHIINILSRLVKKPDYESSVNPQIYIQLKALLDFDPKIWLDSLIYKFNILKYFIEMLRIEERETQEKVKKALDYIPFNYYIRVFELMDYDNRKECLNAIYLAKYLNYRDFFIQHIMLFKKDDIEIKEAFISALVSIRNSITYILKKHDKLEPKKAVELLITLSKRKGMDKKILKIISKDFDSIPKKISEQLILKFSEIEDKSEIISWILGSNFEIISEQTRSELFENLFRNRGNEDKIVRNLRWNFHNFPPHLLLMPFKKLESNYFLAEFISENYNKFNASIRNKILENLSNIDFNGNFIDKAIALNIILTLIYNFEKIPNNIREKILSLLNNEKIGSYIALNIDKYKEKFSHKSLNDFKFLLLNNFKELPSEITNKLLF